MRQHRERQLTKALWSSNKTITVGYGLIKNLGIHIEKAKYFTLLSNE